MRIVVLGGAGKMGCIAVQALVKESRVDEIVIGDFNLEQAQVVADYIKSPKISIEHVDVNEHAKLVSVLRGADTCLNATVYYTNLPIMEACLEAGVHYTDMGGLFHVTRKQLELSTRFAEKGSSAILGMGSAPGVPNIQSRYAADRLDTIEYVRIYDGIKPPAPDDMSFTYAVPTILEEMSLSPMVYENGEFVAKEPLSGFEDYWFTKPLGLLSMHLSLHSEVATIPVSFEDKGVKECFFKINNWGMAKETVEKVRVLAEFGFDSAEPVEVRGTKVAPRDLMIAMMGNFVPPIEAFLAPAKAEAPNWVKEIVTEVKGTKDGKTVTYRLGTLTLKGALPTGTVPALGAIWMAEGRIPPGVYPPEQVIDPEAFFKELEAHEIVTQVTVTEML
ncbi:MAG: saccharopine dehydrogenase NADP-binding domain-containing protein [Chloroflexi bacterium]|nr:saccharopine dehydrogenase NADP-binding domain-containing protein [Chloroflexota bacterium]